MKNIVLCSDGTGNTAVKGRGTNVWKLYEAVDVNGHRIDAGVTRQIAYYDDGVGTERNKFVRALTGAIGWGLSRNVRQLYEELCRSYEPNDQIYLFGFSRGAYTVRTLAGLITQCGVIHPDNWKTDRDLSLLVKKAYGCFRKRFRTAQGKMLRGGMHLAGRALRGGAAAKEAGDAPEETPAARFRREYCWGESKIEPNGRLEIRFVGVWDTVDAVGLPIEELATLLNWLVYPFKFPNRELSEDVVEGCHAIAIDDERKTFHPVLWDERSRKRGGITQVWFPGVHSNVGGGYPKQGISLISLDWMMSKATAAGLRFVGDLKDDYHLRQNVHDKLYNSRSGLAAYYRYWPRDIARICEGNGVIPRIHVSALERAAMGTQRYAPGNIPGRFEVVTSDWGSPSPAEKMEKLREYVRRLTEGGVRGQALLLARARGWIWSRALLNYLLLAVTVAVIVFPDLFPPAPSEIPDWIDRWMAAGLSWLPLGESLYARLGPRPYVLLFPILLWGAGASLQWAAERVFSRHWRSKDRGGSWT